MSHALPSEWPHDTASLIALDRARLLELLDALAAADWDRPTRCPGWRVGDLAAHLLGDDLGYLAGHRDGHIGSRPPDGADGADEGVFIDWLDRLQDDWVRAARRLSPTSVVDLLRWTAPQLVAVVAAEDPSERVAEVSWAGRAPVPRWLDHARELSERWIHRQQVLDALGSPPDLRADLFGPVLDGLRWAYPFRLAPHPRPPGSEVAILVEGSAGRWAWAVRCDGDRWTFAEPGPAERPPPAPGPRPAPGPVATLAMTDDQAWRLLSNNLDVAVHGRPSTDGDPELVAALLGTRAIIGRPNAVD